MNRLITVVIPTLNGGAEFSQLLETLNRQTLRDELELIIIDSGSTDSTLRTASQYNTTVYSINQQDFNHGRTRNWGASCGSGTFLCFFTQDAIPLHDTCIEKMVETLTAHQAAGCFARQIPRLNAGVLVKRDLGNWISGQNNFRKIHLTSMNQYLTLSPYERYTHCVFDNVASMIRRDVWKKIPFPETPFGEDVEWAFRALINGYSVVFEPGAVVEHSHERSASYLYKRTYVDHYRLYELFGLRTVPTKMQAWKSFAYTCMKDWSYLWQRGKLSKRWFEEACRIPIHAWSGVWGQYEGAKSAANGFSIFQSKDV